MPATLFEGRRVEYLRAGRGPGLVLVHGTAGDASATWAPIVERLADRFTIVAPNLPGSGSTSAPAHGLELPAVAATVAAAAHDAGLGAFRLAGYSLGAAVAAQLAADRPESVTSLLLLAGWVRTDPAIAFMLDLWGRVLRADRELFARFVLHVGMTAGFFDRLGPQAVEDAVRRFAGLIPDGTPRHLELDAHVDLTDALARITAPTRVIGLLDDRVVPVSHAWALSAAIPGAELVELPGGHLFPWEQPRELLAQVRELCGR